MTLFWNRIQSDANDQFQAWRQSNWNTGEFLTYATKHGVKTCKLHSARCRHFNNPAVISSRSFASSPKICCTDRQELFAWARAQGATLEGCDCM